MINALIGDKIAIVSDKAQTTRNRIICVYTDEEKQIVFMDTPGVHKPKHKLGEFMVDAAIESLRKQRPFYLLWQVMKTRSRR